jgi:hypothetical protein
MYCHKPEHTHTTTTGLRVTIVPAPRLKGVKLDANGNPDTVKYPNHSQWSHDGWTYYSTLKGINKADYDRIKPDRVIYELGDGTLLQADLALFTGSEMGSHNATQKETACYIHQVSELRVVEMPELEVVLKHYAGGSVDEVPMI